MKKKHLNFIILCLSLVLALIFQVTFWPQSFIAPQPVVCFLIFAVSYRRPVEAGVLYYVFGILSSIFTLASLGTLVFCYFILFSLNIIFNDRFLQKGPSYFSVSCFMNTLIIGLIWPWLTNSSFYFLEWFFSAILTFVFSILFYYYFLWLDGVTEKENLEYLEVIVS